MNTPHRVNTKILRAVEKDCRKTAKIRGRCFSCLCRLMFGPIEPPGLLKVHLSVCLIIACEEIIARIRFNFWTLCPMCYYNLEFLVGHLYCLFVVPNCPVTFYAALTRKLYWHNFKTCNIPSSLVLNRYDWTQLSLLANFLHSLVESMHLWCYELLMQFTYWTCSGSDSSAFSWLSIFARMQF